MAKKQIELKFPKHVMVASYRFAVEYDKEIGGGSFNFSELKIRIGVADVDKSPESVFQVICHEVMEIICCVTGTRFDHSRLEGDFHFFMSHNQFETNVQMFAPAICQWIDNG